jgi:chromatin remodeling complex protein RSC6
MAAAKKKTAKKKAPAKKKPAKKAAKKKAPAKKTAKKAVKKSAKKAAKKKAPARKAAKKAAKKKAPARKTAKKAAKKKAPARKKAARKTGAKRKPNAAFMKAMTPSDALAAVIGGSAMPRTEVTKKIWAYIKRHGLQDSKNRRNINADDKLKPVFGGKKQVSMFEMTKLVNKHLK